MALEKGALCNMLGLRGKIPMNLLRAIVKTPNNTRVTNPTKIGEPEYFVTKSMKRYAEAAITFKQITAQKMAERRKSK